MNSPLYGHLGYDQFEAITNKAVLDICFLLSWINNRSGIAESFGRYRFNFLTSSLNLIFTDDSLYFLHRL